MSVDDSRNGAGAAVRAWFLRHIARPRPAQEFVPQIDGLRFVAIVSVLLYHVQGYVVGKATGAGQAIGLVPQMLGERGFATGA